MNNSFFPTAMEMLRSEKNISVCLSKCLILKLTVFKKIKKKMKKGANF